MMETRRTLLHTEPIVPDYGQRTPTSADIDAIARYLEAMRSYASPAERGKLLDRAGAVFEVYVEQFRRAENG